MSLVAASCPKCGANLEVPEDLDSFFCQYCGTKVIKDIDYVEVSGSVKVEGIVTADSLLERAFIFISDGNFQKAAAYIDNVLDINPKYAKAYFGKFLCQAGAKNTDELISKVVNPLKYKSYSRAVRYASGDQKQEYIAIADSLKEPVKQKKIWLAYEIKNYDIEMEELKSLQQKISGQVKRGEKLVGGCMLLFIALVLLLLIFLISTFFIFSSDMLELIFYADIPLGIAAYLVYKWIKRYINLSVTLEVTKHRIAETHNNLRNAQIQLAQLE